MINLILKDLCFNKKQICFGILASLLFSTIILDSSQYSVVATFMIPSLMFSFGVGKMCFVEDKNNVYSYLKALPILKKDIVVSKFIESILTVLTSYLLIFTVNIILGIFSKNQYILNSNFTIYIFSFILLYNSTYLFLFFKFSYAHAQQSSFVIFAIYIALFAAQKYIFTKPNLSSQNLLAGISIPLVAFAVAIIYSIMLCNLSIVAFSKKE